jgi:hypothetical protein
MNLLINFIQRHPALSVGLKYGKPMSVGPVEIIDKRNPDFEQSRSILPSIGRKKMPIPWTILIDQMDVLLLPRIRRKIRNLTTWHLFLFSITTIE